MNSYLSESKDEQDQNWRTARYGLVGAYILIFSIFFIVFGKEIWTPDREPGRFEFSVSLTAVALMLAGVYFTAFRFFKNDFFFFIFISWLANAVYLIPDVNGPKYDATGYLIYRLSSHGLALCSTVALGFALWSPRKKTIPYSRLFWVGGIGIVGGVSTLLFLSNPPGLEIMEAKAQGIGVLYRDLGYLLTPGSILAFVTLWCTGDVADLHLEDTGPKKALILSFRVYALIQFLYPFFPFMEVKKVVLVPFLLAQFAKVGNAFSLLLIIQLTSARREREKLSHINAQQTQLEKQKGLVQLGMLASSIKHDVGTPLAAMGTELETLKDRYQHDPRITRKFQSLEELMDRIHAKVQVVDFFRGDKEFFNRDEYMKKVNMLELVHRAVRLIKNERGVLKSIDSRDFIKVEGRDVWVRAYGAMFEQVIVNIIKNGLEAIDEAKRDRGLVTIRVNSVEIEKSNFSRWAKVEIHDNGEGIPPENIEKLTTLFTTRSRIKPNSGVGLFISSKILEIHDAHIDFKSTLGVETTVTILMPEWNALQKVQRGIHTSVEPLDGKPVSTTPITISDT